MFIDLISKKFRPGFRFMAMLVNAAFCVNFLMPAQMAFGQNAPLAVEGLMGLPPVGSMVSLTPAFTPVIVRGLKVHPENPLEFDFIVDPGDTGLKDDALRDEANKLIKYFLASLTIPEKEMWVNLSPYEKDRIIPKTFGETEMGRDMLAQDYILKQLTASLMYPEDELGKEFWERVYAKVQSKYGAVDIPTDTFNKVWIVPQEAVVYEKGGSAYVLDCRLKVMLEEDYLARSSSLIAHREKGPHVDSLELTAKSQELKPITSIIREILIPEIEREVNEGKNFANLRQIFHSMILAVWYKKTLKDSLLGKIYVDQNKTKGVDVEDREIHQKIYDQYLAAFKKGVYDYIREDYDPATQEIVPRKYFSGGVTAFDSSKIRYIKDGLQFLSGVLRKSFNRLISGLNGYFLVRWRTGESEKEVNDMRPQKTEGKDTAMMSIEEAKEKVNKILDAWTDIKELSFKDNKIVEPGETLEDISRHNQSIVSAYRSLGSVNATFQLLQMISQNDSFVKNAGFKDSMDFLINIYNIIAITLLRSNDGIQELMRFFEFVTQMKKNNVYDPDDFQTAFLRNPSSLAVYFALRWDDPTLMMKENGDDKVISLGRSLGLAIVRSEGQYSLPIYNKMSQEYENIWFGSVEQYIKKIMGYYFASVQTKIEYMFEQFRYVETPHQLQGEFVEIRKKEYQEVLAMSDRLVDHVKKGAFPGHYEDQEDALDKVSGLKNKILLKVVMIEVAFTLLDLKDKFRKSTAENIVRETIKTFAQKPELAVFVDGFLKAFDSIAEADYPLNTEDFLTICETYLKDLNAFLEKEGINRPFDDISNTLQKVFNPYHALYEHLGDISPNPFDIEIYSSLAGNMMALDKYKNASAVEIAVEVARIMKETLVKDFIPIMERAHKALGKDAENGIRITLTKFMRDPKNFYPAISDRAMMGKGKDDGKSAQEIIKRIEAKWREINVIDSDPGEFLNKDVAQELTRLLTEIADDFDKLGDLDATYKILLRHAPAHPSNDDDEFITYLTRLFMARTTAYLRGRNDTQKVIESFQWLKDMKENELSFFREFVLSQGDFLKIYFAAGYVHFNGRFNGFDPIDTMAGELGVELIFSEIPDGIVSPSGTSELQRVKIEDDAATYRQEVLNVFFEIADQRIDLMREASEYEKIDRLIDMVLMQISKNKDLNNEEAQDEFLKAKLDNRVQWIVFEISRQLAAPSIWSGYSTEDLSVLIHAIYSEDFVNDLRDIYGDLVDAVRFEKLNDQFYASELSEEIARKIVQKLFSRIMPIIQKEGEILDGEGVKQRINAELKEFMSRADNFIDRAMMSEEEAKDTIKNIYEMWGALYGDQKTGKKVTNEDIISAFKKLGEKEDLLKTLQKLAEDEGFVEKLKIQERGIPEKARFLLDIYYKLHSAYLGGEGGLDYIKDSYAFLSGDKWIDGFGFRKAFLTDPGSLQLYFAARVTDADVLRRDLDRVVYMAQGLKLDVHPTKEKGEKYSISWSEGEESPAEIITLFDRKQGQPDSADTQSYMKGIMELFNSSLYRRFKILTDKRRYGEIGRVLDDLVEKTRGVFLPSPKSEGNYVDELLSAKFHYQAMKVVDLFMAYFASNNPKMVSQLFNVVDKKRWVQTIASAFKTMDSKGESQRVGWLDESSLQDGELLAVKHFRQHHPYFFYQAGDKLTIEEQMAVLMARKFLEILAPFADQGEKVEFYDRTQLEIQGKVKALIQDPFTFIENVMPHGLPKEERVGLSDELKNLKAVAGEVLRLWGGIKNKFRHADRIVHDEHVEGTLIAILIEANKMGEFSEEFPRICEVVSRESARRQPGYAAILTQDWASVFHAVHLARLWLDGDTVSVVREFHWLKGLKETEDKIGFRRALFVNGEILKLYFAARWVEAHAVKNNRDPVLYLGPLLGLNIEVDRGQYRITRVGKDSLIVDGWMGKAKEYREEVEAISAEGTMRKMKRLIEEGRYGELEDLFENLAHSKAKRKAAGYSSGELVDAVLDGKNQSLFYMISLEFIRDLKDLKDEGKISKRAFQVLEGVFQAVPFSVLIGQIYYELKDRIEASEPGVDAESIRRKIIGLMIDKFMEHVVPLIEKEMKDADEKINRDLPAVIKMNMEELDNKRPSEEIKRKAKELMAETYQKLVVEDNRHSMNKIWKSIITLMADADHFIPAGPQPLAFDAFYNEKVLLNKIKPEDTLLIMHNGAETTVVWKQINSSSLPDQMEASVSDTGRIVIPRRDIISITVVPAAADKAMIINPDARDRTKGGIDFNPDYLNLQIKRDGKGVALPLEQQNISTIHINGLFPVIIEIIPVSQAPLILGEMESVDEEENSTTL